MTYLNSKCAVCFVYFRACNGLCRGIEGMKARNRSLAFQHARKLKRSRTLVDMDKGTHYDTTQEVGRQDADRFDYLTGQKGT